MAQTGAERVQKHRIKQRARIEELEAEVEALKARPMLTFPKPVRPKKLADSFTSMRMGGYGPSLLAGNHEESFDSFLGGVTVAMAVLVAGKRWPHYLDTKMVGAAHNLLLANVGDQGAVSQYHAGSVFAVRSYLTEIEP